VTDGPSDAELVARIRAGDVAAFETMFRRHYEALVAFARVHTHSPDAARDAVCDVFATLYERRAQWHIASTVRGYLFRAVRNQILHQRRTATREEARYAVLYDEESEAIGLHHVAGADEHLVADEETRARRGALREVVATLSPKARLVLSLRLDRGLSYDEIAEIMETTSAAVQMQLSRALKALRERFPEHLK